MKILLAGVYDTYGGSTFTLLQISKALKDNYMIVLRSPIKESDSKQKCSFPIYTLDTLLKKLKVIKIFYCLLLSELKYLKDKDFDIIIVNDNLALLIYGVIAKVLNKKIVWRVEHSEGKGFFKILRNWLADKKIYISKFMIPKNENEPIIIRNPIAINKYKKKISNSNLKKIFLIGSICDNKNQLFAVKVFKELLTINKSYRLYLVGNILDENYFNKVKDLIKEYSLEDYIFYEGFKSQEYIYSNADLILITSKFESFGLTFLEGIYNSIPVIAPSIDSFKELSEIIGYNQLYNLNDINDCLKKIIISREEEISFSDLQYNIIKNFSLNKLRDDLIMFLEGLTDAKKI